MIGPRPATRERRAADHTPTRAREVPGVPSGHAFVISEFRALRLSPDPPLRF